MLLKLFCLDVQYPYGIFVVTRNNLCFKEKLLAVVVVSCYFKRFKA